MGKLSDFLDLDRYRSQARQHALTRSATTGDLLPTYDTSAKRSSITNLNAGGLNGNHVGGPASGPATARTPDALPLGNDAGQQHTTDGAHVGALEKSNHNDAADATSPASPPPAPPPDTSEAASSGDSALKSAQPDKKPPIPKRVLAATIRFWVHLKNALFHSWVNVLLIFVPVGIVVEALGLNPAVVFALNAVAIVPLAGLLSHATESVASRLGDTLGALLNVSFGNAVELIIFIIALVKNEIRIVQASLLGSILANLLLILGMAFLLGGLRFREQVYNSTVTQMSACLLSLSVTSLLLPTAFHASFNNDNAAAADDAVLKVSRATSVVLLIIYILYLLFQLKSHAYMYESTPQAVIDEESHPGVLADIMNSSSSSDDSSSSDSSDSDSDNSVVAASKRVKRMFKNRRRRKSTASGSSTRTPSVVASTSSPSINQPDDYWNHHHNSQGSGERPRLGVIASGDEADGDDDDVTSPKIRDFGSGISPNDRNSPEPKKRRKKHLKERYKKRSKKRSHRRGSKDAIDDAEKQAEAKEEAVEPSTTRVGFSDEVQVAPAPTNAAPPGRLAFNVRQLSSRVPLGVLANNVFVQPSPVMAARPQLPPGRSYSDGSTLRRTSSLPDRLNNQPHPLTTNTVNRTGPLPPYQHQRALSLRPGTENSELAMDGDEDAPLEMSRTAAVVLLLGTTALVAVCAEFMVDAIPAMIADSPVSQAFIGLIILPIVGNAAEHVTAVTVATKNKMDLAIGVAVGSSIQIALFVTPIVVLLGWILHTDMSLYFNLFETVSLVATAFVINFLILDGRSNYLEGSLLIAVYVIIAVVAFFYPSTAAQSLVGGGGSD